MSSNNLGTKEEQLKGMISHPRMPKAHYITCHMIGTCRQFIDRLDSSLSTRECSCVSRTICKMSSQKSPSNSAGRFLEDSIWASAKVGGLTG